MTDEKPCRFIPWLGEDYGARCGVCGASKRGMMANIDLRHDCKYTTVVVLKTKEPT